jgi:hypothetical protein
MEMGSPLFWKVEEVRWLNLSLSEHPAEAQVVVGTQRLEDPVSTKARGE